MHLGVSVQLGVHLSVHLHRVSRCRWHQARLATSYFNNLVAQPRFDLYQLHHYRRRAWQLHLATGSVSLHQTTDELIRSSAGRGSICRRIVITFT